MNRLNLLFILIILSINISAQIIPANENELFAMLKSDRMDPIVGLYVPQGYQLKYINGELQSIQKLFVPDYKIAIIQKGSCFVSAIFSSCDSIDLSTRLCNIFSTGKPGTYIIDGSKGEISENGNLEWITQIPAKDLAKIKNKPEAEIIGTGYQEVVNNEWIKVYPNNKE